MVDHREPDEEMARGPDRGDGDELAPLDRSSLAQRATDLIRQAIVNGVLPPAETISLREVASRLGVSPTPVREALSHLGAVGLVEFLPGRVKIVASTPESFEDSFRLREALEGMTARLAAQRRTDSEVARLHRFADESVKAVQNGDPKAFRAADVGFHRTIGEAARSPQLSRYTDNALDLALTLRNLRVSGSSFEGGFAVMHRQLADAIEQQDGDRAERLMREHIRNVGERMLALWRTELKDTVASR